MILLYQFLFSALIAGLRRRELILARRLVAPDWARYRALWAAVFDDDPAAPEHIAGIAAEAARLVPGPGPGPIPRQMTRARPRAADDAAAAPPPAPRRTAALWAWLRPASADEAAGLDGGMRGCGAGQRGGLEAGLALDVERWAEGTGEAKTPLSNLDQLFTQACMRARACACWCVCVRARAS